MDREEYYSPRVAFLAQVLCNLNVAARSHGNVQDYEIRSEFLHCRTNGIFISNHANDLIVGLKHFGYATENSGIIVCQ